MEHDYFYGDQANQFTFFRIPYALIADERYDSISTEAKLLYGLLLDRMSLSAKNGWKDEDGKVYIIYTLEEIMATLKCSDKTATKLLTDLENKAHLIERKKHGLGKPATIYVKTFVSGTENHQKLRVKTRKNYESRGVKITSLESENLRPNHTDSIQTDNNQTNKECVADATNRHLYGRYQNVLLSDDEMTKLKAEFPDWEQRIERLSEYIASKGAKYKSHLATIRMWARMDKEKNKQPVPARDLEYPDEDDIY